MMYPNPPIAASAWSYSSWKDVLEVLTSLPSFALEVWPGDLILYRARRPSVIQAHGTLGLKMRFARSAHVLPDLGLTELHCQRSLVEATGAAQGAIVSWDVWRLVQEVHVAGCQQVQVTRHNFTWVVEDELICGEPVHSDAALDIFLAAGDDIECSDDDIDWSV